MNDMLDNDAYPVEERLAMAKELLLMKDRQIQQLLSQLDDEKSTRDWIQDQSGNQRMGL